MNEPEPTMEFLSIRQRLKFDNVFYERAYYNKTETVVWFYENEYNDLLRVLGDEKVEQLNTIYDRTKTNHEKDKT